jgi:hypothetical protein
MSRAIGIARVLCILGIVYVHAWTGLHGSQMAALAGTAQDMLRWGLMEFLGRSAVPLLSLISGWLAVRSLRKRPWRAFIAGKARTVLTPMILWNALAILLVSGTAGMGLIEAPLPTAWRWTVNELLCLWTPNDINVQMSFLRDLFLCLAAAPALAQVPGRALAALLLAAGGVCMAGLPIPPFLRPTIPVFFLAGMLAHRGAWPLRAAAWPVAATAGAYGSFALLKFWLATGGTAFGAAYPWLDPLIDLPARLATALFVWSMAWRLAASKAAAPLLKLEPYSFLMFCAHLIVIWLAGPAIGTLVGPIGSPLYPLFLLSQPALAMAAAVGLGKLLMATWPEAARLLSGGRLDRTEPARVLAASPR